MDSLILFKGGGASKEQLGPQLGEREKKKNHEERRGGGVWLNKKS